MAPSVLAVYLQHQWWKQIQVASSEKKLPVPALCLILIALVPRLSPHFKMAPLGVDCQQDRNALRGHPTFIQSKTITWTKHLKCLETQIPQNNTKMRLPLQPTAISSSSASWLSAQPRSALPRSYMGPPLGVTAEFQLWYCPPFNQIQWLSSSSPQHSFRLIHEPPAPHTFITNDAGRCPLGMCRQSGRGTDKNW